MKIHVKGKKRHDTVFREKFGIGLHQYQSMLEQQDHKCYLCGNVDRTRNLAVDHCHKTGKIRRLLCSYCNTGLGQFKDDPLLLARAIVYLQQEFDLPEDIPTHSVQQADKPRWRNIIHTPDGTFSSAEAAAQYYNVDATSISRWCGAYHYFKHAKKLGWEVEKKYCCLTEIRKEFNTIDKN